MHASTSRTDRKSLLDAPRFIFWPFSCDCNRTSESDKNHLANVSVCRVSGRVVERPKFIMAAHRGKHFFERGIVHPARVEVELLPGRGLKPGPRAFRIALSPRRQDAGQQWKLRVAFDVLHQIGDCGGPSFLAQRPSNMWRKPMR